MASEIKEFYKGANILITGGTGFIGQLLVEKLLRSCSDIGDIYLILRGKNGISASERISITFKGIVFDKLKENNPEFMRKIHVIDGDCSLLKLGLDDSSRQILIEKINVVFHCAACLSMQAKLRSAVDTNVRGLNELIDICREMANLKAMIHVSTFYSNCVYKLIEEKFYKPPLEPQTAINLVKEADTAILNEITQGLMGLWPNIYCYTKAISEEIIHENVNRLPVGLFRPCTLLTTYNDPIPGWASNTFGAIGYVLGNLLGVVRVSYSNPQTRLPIVAADLCINALICTAWDTHLKFKSANHELPIYNYAPDLNGSITLKQLTEYGREYEYPLKDVVWALNHTFVKSRIVYSILNVFMHLIPAYCMHIYHLLIGKRQNMLTTFRRMVKQTEVVGYFLRNDWHVINNNVYKLNGKLNKTDQIEFPFDMNTVDRHSLVVNCAAGIKRYILKETLDNATHEKKRYQRLVKLDKSLKLIGIILLLVLVFKIYSW